jgi:hypothetical protein
MGIRERGAAICQPFRGGAFNLSRQRLAWAEITLGIASAAPREYN